MLLVLRLIVLMMLTLRVKILRRYCHPRTSRVSCLLSRHDRSLIPMSCRCGRSSILAAMTSLATRCLSLATSCHPDGSCSSHALRMIHSILSPLSCSRYRCHATCCPLP